jgi:hypothetical protein
MTDPATGQETPRCLERKGVRCAERAFPKPCLPGTAACMAAFFCFRLLMRATSSERSMRHEFLDTESMR